MKVEPIIFDTSHMLKLHQLCNDCFTEFKVKQIRGNDGIMVFDDTKKIVLEDQHWLEFCLITIPELLFPEPPITDASKMNPFNMWPKMAHTRLTHRIKILEGMDPYKMFGKPKHPVDYWYEHLK